ncbi:MarR family winged helix-turn-helix transcriptional regulator [Robertmurraya andreesenii]|uniref:DNA-binding MarR family transcriptional regulator n=1 Tax=Anoxybacillus andreesenii TaxID=1325932 RepID=A0ABT9V6X9_9BACL|nr:MarR family transcriptional regulator [Robertmurraya andreesenii]MDQ0156714.1 DNA-binding MarR family transcriptional regulator [Robertmurraya andreesenii]
MQYFFQRYIRLYRSIISKLNEILGEHELSFSLWEVLHYVKNNGPSPLVEIADYYHVEKPSITRRVQRLKGQMLVEVVSSSDGREKMIQLSDLGQEVYTVCRRKIDEFEDVVLKDIQDVEKKMLLQILPKIQENILNEEVEWE